MASIFESAAQVMGATAVPTPSKFFGPGPMGSSMSARTRAMLAAQDLKDTYEMRKLEDNFIASSLQRQKNLDELENFDRDRLIRSKQRDLALMEAEEQIGTFGSQKKLEGTKRELEQKETEGQLETFGERQQLESKQREAQGLQLSRTLSQEARDLYNIQQRLDLSKAQLSEALYPAEAELRKLQAKQGLREAKDIDLMYDQKLALTRDDLEQKGLAVEARKDAESRSDQYLGLLQSANADPTSPKVLDILDEVAVGSAALPETHPVKAGLKLVASKAQRAATSMDVLSKAVTAANLSAPAAKAKLAAGRELLRMGDLTKFEDLLIGLPSGAMAQARLKNQLEAQAIRSELARDIGSTNISFETLDQLESGAKSGEDYVRDSVAATIQYLNENKKPEATSTGVQPEAFIMMPDGTRRTRVVPKSVDEFMESVRTLGIEATRDKYVDNFDGILNRLDKIRGLQELSARGNVSPETATGTATSATSALEQSRRESAEAKAKALAGEGSPALPNAPNSAPAPTPK